MTIAFVDPDDLKRGEAAAWSAFVREFRPSIGRYARRMGVVDVDEVTGATLESVTRRIMAFEGDGAGFRSWVFTIAHARIVDDLRRRSRYSEVEFDQESEPEVETLDPVTLGPILSTDPRVELALDLLSADQRRLLELRFVLGSSCREIAEATGRSEAAIRVALHRTTRQLRELLTSAPAAEANAA